MAVPYSALLLASDVTTELQSAFTSLNTGDADTLKALEAMIQGVTGMVEGAAGLGRNLIVREYTHYVQHEDWDWDEARDRFFIRAPQWPVVEIDTSGFTIGTSTRSWQNEQDLILYTSRFSGLINYYAGYKRAEQTLVALQTPLPNLGTEPSDLPYDIREVALDAVLWKMAVRRHGPGTRTKTISPAVQTTTIEQPLLDYVRLITMERINHHKRFWV